MSVEDAARWADLCEALVRHARWLDPTCEIILETQKGPMYDMVLRQSKGQILVRQLTSPDETLDSLIPDSMLLVCDRKEAKPIWRAVLARLKELREELGEGGGEEAGGEEAGDGFDDDE